MLNSKSYSYSVLSLNQARAFEPEPEPNPGPGVSLTSFFLFVRAAESIFSLFERIIYDDEAIFWT